jgi:EAL domain-containing protein (putative c-di-GMP-specific phosphodiesterase class I)
MAMSRAKGLGGDRVVAFDAAMHRAAIARMHLESDLSVAIDRQELFLRYQPIVDLRTGCVARLEALVRWRRGDTIVPPGDFVPISEGTGFIVPMSRWVLAEAAARTREWLALAPDLRIAVNVSGRHFMLPSFADDVFGALEAAGLPARNLELEITESVAMADAARAVRVIERLRDGGVSTSIDDFGTGYSSLAYLHRFPVDALKIDRSFVSDTEPGADAWPIVRSILALATQRGMSVVAEGVESTEQLARLRALGCPYAQGFLLSRPLAAADVPPMFAGPLL